MPKKPAEVKPRTPRQRKPAEVAKVETEGIPAEYANFPASWKVAYLHATANGCSPKAAVNYADAHGGA